jgi:hypothetical protein
VYYKEKERRGEDSEERILGEGRKDSIISKFSRLKPTFMKKQTACKQIPQQKIK